MKHNSCTLNVIKSNAFQQQHPTANIFQTNLKSLLTPFNSNTDKPVGGMVIFMRQHKRRHRLSNSRKNLNGTQRKIHPRTPQSQHDTQNRSVKPDKSQRQRLAMKKINQHEQEQKIKNQDIKEQYYKTHQQFRPKTAISSKSCNRPYSGIFKNTKINQKSRLSEKQERKSQNLKDQDKMVKKTLSNQLKKSQQWANLQIQRYNQKYAILGELAYEQPLQKKYGDRYFQYNLRNRYKDELRPGPYVYQIKKSQNQLNKQHFIQSFGMNAQSEKFQPAKQTLITGPGNTYSKIHMRFLSTLRKFRPEIGCKQRLILKGTAIQNYYQQDY